MKRELTTILMILLCTLMAQAQTSKVNVTIDGPGVVDEYYVLNSDGSKQIKLKAVPSKFLGNVTFDGWSGDATGTSEELIVDADKAQNIHAVFTYHRPVKQYPLLNLKQSWADMGKPMYIEMPVLWNTQDVTVWRGTNYLPVDYNRDGYIDYVQFPKRGSMGIDNNRENVRFWLGKPDGSFEEDPKNDNRMAGTVYSIILKYADFNDDGYPDFCSFSSGYDRGGSTFDYPVILMSSPDGVYKDLRYTNINNGYFHGGTTGDFDNDGDIDVLFWDMNHAGDGENSLYLENDGKGNFKQRDAKEIIDIKIYQATLPDPIWGTEGSDFEVLDLNNDGYNDIILCGMDHQDPQNGYCSPPVVLWGNSTGKFGSDFTVLPQPRLGYGISSTFAFYDFNGDGVKEIIVDKTGDGVFGNSHFYMSGYLQVCELENGKYVDKTEQYIPVENQSFNDSKSEIRLWIENVDGTDYVCEACISNSYYQGLGVGPRPIYAIRNGIMEPVSGYTTTKTPSFEEGFPLYADEPWLSDRQGYGDGLNATDTLPEHHWVEIADYDYVGGNMWRIDLHHRNNPHSGRTCIRWNRDGQDPGKEKEKQGISFDFISNVDISKLRSQAYTLELYIKNSDPDLSLIINSVEIDAKNTDEGYYTGEWQRMSFLINKIWDGPFNGIGIEVGKGDLNNEFYLDDIRIRRIYETAIDEFGDYGRAFIKDYLERSYINKERTAQVKSQEFKTMLKPLIQKFAPDSMTYFNSYITDLDVPLTRGMATCMAYYTARCIGAETDNLEVGEQPEDIWITDNSLYERLLPHWQDPGEADYPENMYWRSTVFGGWMTAFYWNFRHVSDHSKKNTIALDEKVNSFHWDNPFTWEDAISAITRLYDSTDREPVAVPGDANGDGVMNVTDIVATVNYIMEKPSDGFNKEAADLNGDGDINVTDIVKMVTIIMSGESRQDLQEVMSILKSHGFIFKGER